jgi:hypothetical protein
MRATSLNLIVNLAWTVVQITIALTIVVRKPTTLASNRLVRRKESRQHCAARKG